MKVYISINGVLRNYIQKLECLYVKDFIDNEPEEKDDDFEYRITHPIHNDNLLKSFAFHSKTEFENYCFIEYPLEIFGHSGLSYGTAISDLNKLIYENTDINFTIIGIDELGRAKPSTLFFLSKYGILANNVKFINSSEIEKEWKKCDLWVTDNYDIIKKCPKNKMVVKFNTQYNCHFNHNLEINDLTEIIEIWKKYSGKNFTSMLMNLSKSVERIMGLKKTKMLKNQK